MEIIAIIIANIYRRLLLGSIHFTGIKAILITMLWVGGINSAHFKEL